MTKKDINRAIVGEFLDTVQEKFPQYESFDEGDGRISFTPSYTTDGSWVSDNTIQFHRSRYTLDAYNWRNKDTKKDLVEMGGIINELLRKYNV